MSYEFSSLGSSEGATRRYSLAGDVCIFHAEALKPQLLEILEPAAAVEIDLAGIEEIDTAGVQLLLVAKRQAAHLECQLGFVNHSEPLLEIIDLLNLSLDFGDPLLLTAQRQDESHESQ